MAELQAKDREEITSVENNYICIIEKYIDDKINDTLTTDNSEVWIDINYVKFNYNPLNNKNFPSMTNTRKKILQAELLSRYEKANWKIEYEFDDGLDGNMSGGDYLILKGIKR